MENAKVYRVNEYDAVAAISEEQAKEWYLKTTGMDVDEVFEGYEGEVLLHTKVWEDERMENKITVEEIIKEYWKGEPFIAFSTEF